MTPIVIENLNGDVVFSGKANLVLGNDVTVSSSVGTVSHKFDAKTPLIKIVLPVRDEIEDWIPPEDPNEQVFMVETAESAAERTAEEEETNRVDGTIMPQDQKAANVETEEVTVSSAPPPEDESTEPTEESSEFELS